jgi:leucyl aminopeptidase
VAVDVVAWSTTADRLELYYQTEPGAAWMLMGTKFPPAVGRTTVTFPMQLNYGGPVQAVRAVFRYAAASSSACPSDMSVYDDIDDLSFTVAPAYAGYSFN